MWKTCLYSVFNLVIVMVAGFAYAAVFQNPINAGSFPELLQSVARALITIAVPLAVMAIIIIGVRFVIAGSRGDEGELKSVRKLFWWVVIGTAIIVGGSILIDAVVNTITNL